MSTTDYLTEHAAKNVWCSPEQDYQYIVRPRRISPKAGVRNRTEVLWSTIPLPTSTDWYHLYQIGEITPSALGLNGLKMRWVKVSDHCNVELLLADLYTKAGVQLPRFTSYFLVTTDGNLLLAVMDIPKIAKLGLEDLFVRFYSNAYFNTAEAQAATEGLVTKGTRILNSDQQYTFQREWRTYVGRSGHAYAFVNGQLVYDLNTLTVNIGDYVEYVWDSSIKTIVELPVTGIPGFQSDLDKKQKFLLHYPGISDTIDYRDDIDIFLIKRTNENIYSGVYYHKNVDDAVRMVTHKDYSIPVQYVMGYVADHPVWQQLDELTVRVHIRKAGYKRPLINEHHRIKELYKLKDEDVVRAMMGTESNVPEWRAESLESSQYPVLMRSITGRFAKSTVQDTYGYNAISKLVADTPQRIPANDRWIELPPGLWINSTVYEYDSNGVLLEWSVHGKGKFYVPRNPACKSIEAIVGKGGQRLTTSYGKSNVPLQDGVNYRFYVCSVSDDVPLGDWIDVSGDSNYYDIVGGVVLWKVDPRVFYTAIKNDETFLAYDLNLAYRDGILRFTVNVDEMRTDGIVYPGKAEIPFGALDLWLNGRALIRNLDYFVLWPEICIVNKDYLVDGANQRVSIRGTGFCTRDMETPLAADYGFVKYGLLSKNNRFDVRDDKVMRVVVDGKLYHRDQLVFSEDDSGIRLDTVRNGAPYQVSDIIVPLRGLIDVDTYGLRDRSIAVDVRISDYMTRKLPEPKNINPNPIPQLYPIYSPYASKVMYDLLHGILPMDDFKGQYNDMTVRAALEPYKWLIKYDPVFRPEVDTTYVSIHPHNLKTEITLDVYQYRFLLRTIRLILKDRVDITKFVTIEAGFEHETPDHPHPYRTAG
jgi:plastocyanin